MWTVRDSDGAETLHSVYPGWANDSDHLTIITYVKQAMYEAVVKELAEAQKEISALKTMANQHMRTTRYHHSRMREIESANNKYYALLQQHGLYKESPPI